MNTLINPSIKAIIWLMSIFSLNKKNPIKNKIIKYTRCHITFKMIILPYFNIL